MLIKSYNHTLHNILENEINLILPQIPGKQKCGITTMLVSIFIGLAYEGISSLLHHWQNKALHKAINAMDDKGQYPVQQANAIGKFNVNVWHLQCGNPRKINQHCSQYTQHNFLT